MEFLIDRIQNMKKIAIIIIASAVVLLAAGAGIFIVLQTKTVKPVKQPSQVLQRSDFIVKNFQDSDLSHSCLWPNDALGKRCHDAGGEFVSNTYVSDAFTIGGSKSEFNCFPTKKTTDYRKPCATDADCQGFCVIQKSDISSFRFCSDFKSPIFAIDEKALGNQVCRNYEYFSDGADHIPITLGDFVIQDSPRSHASKCVLPSPGLETRCRVLGGYFGVPKSSFRNTLHSYYSFNCYPAVKTTDVGKSCKTDKDCQGWCDYYVPKGFPSFCSDLGKPLLSINGSLWGYDLCPGYLPKEDYNYAIETENGGDYSLEYDKDRMYGCYTPTPELENRCWIIGGRLAYSPATENKKSFIECYPASTETITSSTQPLFGLSAYQTPPWGMCPGYVFPTEGWIDFSKK